MDVSTGQFSVTQVQGASALRCELSRLEPRELVLPDEARGHRRCLGSRLQHFATSHPGSAFFEPSRAQTLIDSLLGPSGEPTAEQAVERFDSETPGLAISAASAVVAYVVDTQQQLPDHTRFLTPYRTHDTLILDETAKMNLELFRTLVGGRKRGSLLGTLDRASSAMGGRRMRQWMAYPLIDPVAINARLDAVEWLTDNPDAGHGLRHLCRAFTTWNVSMGGLLQQAPEIFGS